MFCQYGHGKTKLDQINSPQFNRSIHFTGTMSPKIIQIYKLVIVNKKDEKNGDFPIFSSGHKVRMCFNSIYYLFIYIPLVSKGQNIFSHKLIQVEPSTFILCKGG